MSAWSNGQDHRLSSLNQYDRQVSGSIRDSAFQRRLKNKYQAEAKLVISSNGKLVFYAIEN